MGHSRMVWPAVLLTLVAFGGAFAGSPGAGGSYVGDVNVSAILDSFSVSYDKRVRPNYGGPPVDVGVTMYVLSISSLSEVQMARLWMSESPCMC
uniref:Gamma-aminobutyric acid receptor subunit beta-like isoform X2 n=1 Tax=Diabrotica virgifera virgifera TaxID=50390 RepID=A0A6P7GDW3_DIAVI